MMFYFTWNISVLVAFWYFVSLSWHVGFWEKSTLCDVLPVQEDLRKSSGRCQNLSMAQVADEM